MTSGQISVHVAVRLDERMDMLLGDEPAQEQHEPIGLQAIDGDRGCRRFPHAIGDVDGIGVVALAKVPLQLA